MPKRSKAETDILVTIAAGFFATHTRDAKKDRQPTRHNRAERPSMAERENGKRFYRPSTTRASGTSESNPDGVKRE